MRSPDAWDKHGRQLLGERSQRDAVRVVEGRAVTRATLCDAASNQRKELAPGWFTPIWLTALAAGLCQPNTFKQDWLVAQVK